MKRTRAAQDAADVEISLIDGNVPVSQAVVHRSALLARVAGPETTVPLPFERRRFEAWRDGHASAPCDIVAVAEVRTAGGRA